MNVFIADDDPGFRTTVQRLLEAREGTGRIWEATDGEEVTLFAKIILAQIPVAQVP